MADHWKPIPGYPGYSASTTGEICGPRGRVLRPAPNRDGYLRVICMVDGIRLNRCVHRLVLFAYAGEPDPGQQARHLNGDRTDNRAANLAWGSVSENRVRHGTHQEAAKTNCPSGHPYAGSNLYITPNGNRKCRTCNRERGRQHRANVRSAA